MDKKILQKLAHDYRNALSELRGEPKNDTALIVQGKMIYIAETMCDYILEREPEEGAL